MWLCECECGGVSEVNTGNLKNGHTKSCGCITKPDMIGEKFGRLTVISESPIKKNGAYWICECECGNETTVKATRLRSGKTKSCGCLKMNPNLTNDERTRNRYVLGGTSSKNWRKAIYDRDDYTCKLCGVRGAELNAHHLYSWGWHVDKRFDLDNGITLCKNCHEDFHKVYGFGDNTPEQFRQFQEETKC